ncbi:UDP-N-acetylmuramate dehydrogenase [Spongiimicrobium salis]|uniref:UDP-N-acetylmuramate dehydrogenase n=1 Tax=Spongiimicrobium salis TaxID=1667022 RepID=UPI00374CDA5B
MVIEEYISLKPYNTFGIDVKARFFCEVTSIDTLKKALSSAVHERHFFISGGSNMLLTQDIDALVIYINIKGIEIVKEDTEEVTLKVMAGENWHHMVLWTLDRAYGGLENLSLIPGNTGTAPIQNIGAYGVELKDCFVSCEALELESLKMHTFSKEACQFGYRDSFFKNEGKGKYVITAVYLVLSKNQHSLHTSYGAIQEELRSHNIAEPTIKDISNAVIAIRQRKLPDPKVLGNSGSFFKNPVLSKDAFDTFIRKNNGAPYYELSDGTYKIPAGWLIEQCGFKGKRFGDAGVHKHQALVLVNYGNASGQEILDLSQNIVEQVYKTFGISIVPEVNII